MKMAMAAIRIVMRSRMSPSNAKCDFLHICEFFIFTTRKIEWSSETGLAGHAPNARTARCSRSMGASAKAGEKGHGEAAPTRFAREPQDHGVASFLVFP